MRRGGPARPGAGGIRRLAGFLDGVAGGRRGAADEELFAVARERGLIEKTEAGWRVSEAGRAWLARQRAEQDPFLAQHAEITRRTVEVAGTRRTVSVNAAESPLAWLARRKGRDGAPLISSEQFAAGERLRGDFTRARLMPSVTASWSQAPHRVKRRSGEPGGAADLLDGTIAARARVNKALAAVGPELADILVDVCCFLRGLEAVERANGWPSRSGKLILQMALTRLARHYGIAPPSKAAARRLRHWGDADYRPTVDGA